MGLERPRGSIDVILSMFFHIFAIVFCGFPTFSEVSGWGGRVSRKRLAVVRRARAVLPEVLLEDISEMEYL